MKEDMTFKEMLEILDESNNRSNLISFKPPTQEEIIESVAKYMMENMDIAEIEKKFLEIGVNVKHEDGIYKNLVDVLKETSEIFNRR